MSLSFNLLKKDGTARRGVLNVRGISIDTPVFMPVGTLATVKGLTSDQIADTTAKIILANTYHLNQVQGIANDALDHIQILQHLQGIFRSRVR